MYNNKSNAIIIVFISLILFCSCTGIVDAIGNRVYLSLSVEKGITATKEDEVSYLKYRCLRNSNYQTSEGIVSEWTQVTINNSGERLIDLGWITSGHWLFEVNVYSKNDKVLYSGSADVYLNGGGTKTIPIVCTQHSGEEGTVKFDITALKTTSEQPQLGAFWKAYDTEDSDSFTSWTVTDLGSSWRFTGETTTKEDRYLLTVNLYSSKKDGSTVCDMMVVGGEVTEVTGFINPGSDISSYIEITGPSMIKGTIERSGNFELGKAVTFKWINLADTPTKYTWTVNGELLYDKSTYSSISYTPTETGTYRIVCCAFDDENNAGYAVYTVDLTGAIWEPFGSTIVTDKGSSYGTYEFSLGNTMCKRTSGTGGRYIVVGGVLEGKGSETSPYICWAPYVNGKGYENGLNTSSTSGIVASDVLKAKDSSSSAHSYNGSYYISVGGALASLKQDNVYVPSYSEMQTIMAMVNKGTLFLADGKYWTSTDGSTSATTAWVMVVSGGSATMTNAQKLSKLANAKVLYLRVV